MKQKIKVLEFEEIPCWYRLRFESDPVAIVVEVHEECIPQLPLFQRDNAMVYSIMRECNLITLFDSFSWNMDHSSFGIGNEIERLTCVSEGVDSFVRYRVQLPRFNVFSNEVCEYCSGSGKNEDSHDSKCLRCLGYGKKNYLRWDDVYRAGINLSLLLMLLDRPPEVDTSSTFQQLAIVRFNGGQRPGIGGSFSGGLTRIMRHCAYIMEQMEKPILEAMFATNAHLSPAYKADKFSMRVQTDPGCFSLTCPGDACGIHTNNLYSISDFKKGVEFSDHNVDSPMQAFTLLAGLATFLEKAEVHVSRRSSQVLATA